MADDIRCIFHIALVAFYWLVHVRFYVQTRFPKDPSISWVSTVGIAVLIGLLLGQFIGSLIANLVFFAGVGVGTFRVLRFAYYEGEPSRFHERALAWFVGANTIFELLFAFFTINAVAA